MHKRSTAQHREDGWVAAVWQQKAAGRSEHGGGQGGGGCLVAPPLPGSLALICIFPAEPGTKALTQEQRRNGPGLVKVYLASCTQCPLPTTTALRAAAAPAGACHPPTLPAPPTSRCHETATPARPAPMTAYRLGGRCPPGGSLSQAVASGVAVRRTHTHRSTRDTTRQRQAGRPRNNAQPTKLGCTLHTH